jgi:hypothetical protein
MRASGPLYKRWKGTTAVKDFDAEFAQAHAERESEMAERSFKLGGKTFTYAANPSYTGLGQITSEGEGDVIGRLEEGLLRLMDDGQEEEFLAVLRDKKSKVTLNDLNTLIAWVIEQQTGRPTQAPSLSTPGGATTSTPSTAGSSSKLAEASAA